MNTHNTINTNDAYNITNISKLVNCNDNNCVVTTNITHQHNITNNTTIHNHNNYEHNVITQVHKHITHINNYDTDITHYSTNNSNNKYYIFYTAIFNFRQK